MLADQLNDNNLALSLMELAKCQESFDSICADLSVEKGSPAAKKLAVYVFELYRQGIRNSYELKQLASMAMRQY